jgi:hypothetical protein
MQRLARGRDICVTTRDNDDAGLARPGMWQPCAESYRRSYHLVNIRSTLGQALYAGEKGVLWRLRLSSACSAL